MTATEVRADAVVRLAEWHAEGTLPDADADLMLRAIFPNINPAVYSLHWGRVIAGVEEARDIDMGKWDDTGQLAKADAYTRIGIRDGMVAEVRRVARDHALSCVMVCLRHAGAKYLDGAA